MLQGVDTDALNDMTALLPQIQKLLDEFNKQGGYAILSLLREQIANLERKIAGSVNKDDVQKLIDSNKIM